MMDFMKFRLIYKQLVSCTVKQSFIASYFES